MNNLKVTLKPAGLKGVRQTSWLAYVGGAYVGLVDYSRKRGVYTFHHKSRGVTFSGSKARLFAHLVTVGA